jgi:hypothetical protein
VSGGLEARDKSTKKLLNFHSLVYIISLYVKRAGRKFSGEAQWIFAPAEWELLEERAIENDASDHRAVVARFSVRGG